MDSEPRAVSLGPDPVESSVELSCTVVNQGSYSWQWSFEGVHLTQPDTLSDATRTSTITISSLSADKAGLYQCQATVGSQSRAQNFSLRLDGKWRLYQIKKMEELETFNCSGQCTEFIFIDLKNLFLETVQLSSTSCSFSINEQRRALP